MTHQIDQIVSQWNRRAERSGDFDGCAMVDTKIVNRAKLFYDWFCSVGKSEFISLKLSHIDIPNGSAVEFSLFGENLSGKLGELEEILLSFAVFDDHVALDWQFGFVGSDDSLDLQQSIYDDQLTVEDGVVSADCPAQYLGSLLTVGREVCCLSVDLIDKQHRRVEFFWPRSILIF